MATDSTQKGALDGASSPRSGVLFDVDGTLVDSNYLHTLAWSRAFADTGEWAPMHAIHRLVGMGGDQLVPMVLEHPSPDAIRVRRQRFAELQGEVRVFPGATRLLQRTHELGLAVVLASSSPRDELDATRALLGVDDCIDAVTTADDTTRSKPRPDIFLVAMERAHLDPERVLVIGDSIWDVRAARGAGLGCIGLESGGFSRHELSEDGALAVYRDAGELCAQLRTSPIAALLS
jgi:HAD superfamily hydrolase (TIGR01509 family)